MSIQNPLSKYIKVITLLEDFGEAFKLIKSICSYIEYEIYKI